MKYTEKKDQREILKDFVEQWVKDFEENYPTRTIGNHHYIRRRHLENFLYDYTVKALSKIKENTIILE